MSIYYIITKMHWNYFQCILYCSYIYSIYKQNIVHMGANPYDIILIYSLLYYFIEHFYNYYYDI